MNISFKRHPAEEIHKKLFTDKIERLLDEEKENFPEIMNSLKDINQEDFNLEQSIDYVGEVIKNNFNKWEMNNLNTNKIADIVQFLKELPEHIVSQVYEIIDKFKDNTQASDLSIDEIQRQVADLTSKLGSNDAGFAVVPNSSMDLVFTGEKDIQNVADENTMVPKPNDLPPEFEQNGAYITQSQLDEINRIKEDRERELSQQQNQDLEQSIQAENNVSFKRTM